MLRDEKHEREKKKTYAADTYDICFPGSDDDADCDADAIDWTLYVVGRGIYRKLERSCRLCAECSDASVSMVWWRACWYAAFFSVYRQDSQTYQNRKITDAKKLVHAFQPTPARSAM